jgi:hypothetical protein
MWQTYDQVMRDPENLLRPGALSPKESSKREAAALIEAGE